MAVGLCIFVALATAMPPTLHLFGEPGVKGSVGLPSVVPGPTGPKGIRGEVGPEGVKGPAGDPGATGLRGPDGPRGFTGRPGPKGYAGTQGIHGPFSPDSEDAQVLTVCAGKIPADREECSGQDEPSPYGCKEASNLISLGFGLEDDGTQHQVPLVVASCEADFDGRFSCPNFGPGVPRALGKGEPVPGPGTVGDPLRFTDEWRARDERYNYGGAFWNFRFSESAAERTTNPPASRGPANDGGVFWVGWQPQDSDTTQRGVVQDTVLVVERPPDCSAACVASAGARGLVCQGDMGALVRCNVN